MQMKPECSSPMDPWAQIYIEAVQPWAASKVTELRCVNMTEQNSAMSTRMWLFLLSSSTGALLAAML